MASWKSYTSNLGKKGGTLRILLVGTETYKPTDPTWTVLSYWWSEIHDQNHPTIYDRRKFRSVSLT
jgi:hypothetical protein